MADTVPMQVTSGVDRHTQREQIELVLARAREKREPVRVRLPLALYDHEVTRGYVYIRDATWNLQLPYAQTTPDTIEHLIKVLDRCIQAIAAHGSDAVDGAIRELGGEQ